MIPKAELLLPAGSPASCSPDCINMHWFFRKATAGTNFNAEI